MRRYSLPSIIIMLIACAFLMFLNLRPQGFGFIGGYGFPIHYQTWSCTTSNFYYWRLVADILIAFAIIASMGFIMEKFIMKRFYSVGEIQNAPSMQIPTSRIFAYTSLFLFISGVFFPFTIYDDFEPTPSISLWIIAQVLAIFFGVISRHEKISHVTIILAILALLMPVLVYIVFGVQATEAPM